VITQQYDEQAAGIFTYTGTATEMVILSATFWLPTCLHIFLILMCEFYKPCPQGTDFKKDFDANSYQGCEPVKAFLFKNFVLKPGSHGPITSLCQFLTVFFATACFSRYTEMYSKCIGIQGKMHNISVYLRVYFSKPGTRWNVLRYLLCVHEHFLWVNRRRTFDYGKSLENPGTFDELVDTQFVTKGLLIKKEAEALKEYKNDKNKLLFTWAIIALKRIMEINMPAGEKGNSMLFNAFERTALVQNVKNEIVEMRADIGSIMHSLVFPFPWPYFHVVGLIVHVQLFFLAISSIQIDKMPDGAMRCRLVSCVVLPIICYVFAAIISVANAMADPFGQDHCDFNQQALINGVFNDCKKLCDADDEEFLASIGDPRFNPKRNPDGTLVEESEEGPVTAAPEIPPPVLIPQSEVEVILSDKAALEHELRIGGVSKLSVCVRQLTETVEQIVKNQQRAQQDQLLLRDTIFSVQGQIKLQADECSRIASIAATQMDRVTRLETLQAQSLLSDCSEGSSAKEY